VTLARWSGRVKTQRDGPSTCEYLGTTEIHLTITAYGHGLGLFIDFDNVLGSCDSVSSVNQTSRKPEAGSNQDKTHQEAQLKNIVLIGPTPQALSGVTHFNQLFTTSISNVICDEEYDLFIHVHQLSQAGAHRQFEI